LSILLNIHFPLESELKKIGCRIEKGADRVLIKTLDTEIDEFVSSLMKETELNY